MTYFRKKNKLEKSGTFSRILLNNAKIIGLLTKYEIPDKSVQNFEQKQYLVQIFKLLIKNVLAILVTCF